MLLDALGAFETQHANATHYFMNSSGRKGLKPFLGDTFHRELACYLNEVLILTWFKKPILPGFHLLL